MFYLATPNGCVQGVAQKPEAIFMKKIVISVLVVLAFPWISVVSAEHGPESPVTRANGAIDPISEVDVSINGIIDIQAHIDGRDQLILKGNTIQWHHFDFAAVGRHIGSNAPTIVGGIQGISHEWLPVWPSPPPDEIRFEAFSSVLQGVMPSVPSDGVPWQVEKVFGRGEVSIIEQPTFANDFTLIVEFNDNLIGGSTFYGVILSQAPTDLEIDIDIKPGNTINPVNPRSKGILKIAILTTDNFDASTVDTSSIYFGPGAAEPVMYRLDDVDDDGDWDLALKFNTQDTGITCGDTEATLTGQTFDGVQITGRDSINTAGCK